MSNTDLIPPQTANFTELTPEIVDGSQKNPAVQVDSPQPLLPRSAWSSNVAYLRAMFKVKKALDRIEAEAGIKL
ncbi:hypothetical protein [Anabaena sp. 4-3]|uniref:hypothetical protein n=1 Tax=Anabaena sp. 4-3 TaxID=1811979 RepID=UPI000830A67A|nr:hypothetical protein [Anabaena sp. 4-3]